MNVKVGLVYGLIGLLFLAFVSYVAATFVVDTMAGVNALHTREKNKKALELQRSLSELNSSSNFKGESPDSGLEYEPLLAPFPQAVEVNKIHPFS